MTTYVGDEEEITVRITKDDLLVDPSTLTLVLTPPTGPTITYVFGVDPEITKEGVGQYFLTLLLNQKGLWRYEWTSTGPVATVLRGAFDVHPQPVPVIVVVQTVLTAIPQENAFITFLASDQTTIVGGGSTDATGQLTVYLEPDLAYYLEIRKEDSFLDAHDTIQVLDQPSQDPFVEEVTPLGVQSSFSPPRTVLVYGYVQDPGFSREVIVETTGRAPLTGNIAASGIRPANILVPKERRTLSTNAQTGYWGVSLYVNSSVHISIPSVGFETFFRVPDDASVLTLNVADARPDPDGGRVGTTWDSSGQDALRGTT